MRLSQTYRSTTIIVKHHYGDRDPRTDTVIRSTNVTNSNGSSNANSLANIDHSTNTIFDRRTQA